MRIWSVHPQFLDRQGLIACWRETLLAQAVLGKSSGGYAHHPQLQRFRAAADPAGTLGRYLAGLADEADRRGYRFDRTRIRQVAPRLRRLPVTDGQLAFERAHLLGKLQVRNPDLVAGLPPELLPHPVFRVVPGGIAEWER